MDCSLLIGKHGVGRLTRALRVRDRFVRIGQLAGAGVVNRELAQMTLEDWRLDAF
jgi:hypothetical protein